MRIWLTTERVFSQWACLYLGGAAALAATWAVAARAGGKAGEVAVLAVGKAKACDMKQHKNVIGAWVEYGILFVLVVVLGTTQASFVTWVIVGVIYVCAMALSRRLFGSA